MVGYYSIIAFIFSSQMLFAQQVNQFCVHDSIVYLGDNLLAQKSYKKALLQYEKAITLIPNDSKSPYFKAAYCALNLKNNELALNFVKNGVIKSGFNEVYIHNYDGFQSYKNTFFWKQIQNNYPSWRKIYFLHEVSNIDVYLKVEKLVHRDQFARKIGEYLNDYSEEDIRNAIDSLNIAKKESDSIKIKKYNKIVFGIGNDYEKIEYELQEKVDSLNAIELMEITKLHGWQPRAWILLWHHRGNHDEDNIFWNYFRPLINQEIKSGNLRPSFWAIFDDFKQYITDGGTIYGTRPGKVNDVINEKRKEICLPPIN